MSHYTDDIIELNRDVEPFIIQGSATRAPAFKRQDPEKFPEKYKVLQFVHTADMHNQPELWDRMVKYINHYSEYIAFGIHTGDYCGGWQDSYTDFYVKCTKCVRPIYNCVGNHDTVRKAEDGGSWDNDKKSAHDLLFNHKDEWNATFCPADNSMTYYIDYEESNIRIIVLDLYYDIEIQIKWLCETLDDAMAKGISVITAMHEPSGPMNNSFGVTFHTINDYEGLVGRREQQPFEPIIADFISAGGKYICNLAGHDHHDSFGFSDSGVLNVIVESGTCWDGWCDGKRIKGTRTYDAFNVMSVDVNLGILKLVRVGDNVDNYLRIKRTLCYDYVNKKIIFCG